MYQQDQVVFETTLQELVTTETCMLVSMGTNPHTAPGWADMSMEDRWNILDQAMFCDHCLGPRKKIRRQRMAVHKRDECLITKKKNRYS